MKSTILMADGLELPATGPGNAATQVLAFMGRRGSGKTYGAGRFIEGLLDHGHQVVVLDPVGVWWGLRLAKDGKMPAYSIPLFGGWHGDIPLEASGGKVVAQLVAEQQRSLVLDVSEFSEADQRRFVADFASELLQAKKQHRSSVMVVLEEAQEFCPQNVDSGEARMVGAVQRLAKLGRNFGIGLSIISQRPQDVNKKLLNQMEVMFAFQLVGPQERKAIQGWVEQKGASGRDDLGSELPALAVGEPIVWSPQWLGVYGKFKLLPKSTFDSSATPDQATATAAGSLAPIDLEAVKLAMAVSLDNVKANDPKLLREEIERLRKQLAGGAGASKEVQVEVPFVPTEVTAGLVSIRSRLEAAAGAVNDLLTMVHVNWDVKRTGVPPLGLQEQSASVAAKVEKNPAWGIDREVAKPARPMPPPRPSAPRARNGHDLPSGAVEMLQALASLGGKATKRQLATLAGFAPSVSTVRNYLSLLKGGGLITTEGDQVNITRAGLDRAGPSPPKLPSELLAMWSREAPGKAKEILALYAAEHGPFTDEVIRRRCSVPPGGSTLRNYKSFLRTNGLIVKSPRGYVVNPLLAH